MNNHIGKPSINPASNQGPEIIQTYKEREGHHRIINRCLKNPSENNPMIMIPKSLPTNIKNYNPRSYD